MVDFSASKELINPCTCWCAQERVQRVTWQEMDILRGMDRFCHSFFFALVSIVFHRTHPPHSPTHYLTGMARPPPKIRLTLEGVCLMLGHNSVEWEDIRKVSMQSSEISHSNTTINTTPTVSCTVIPRSFYDKANSLRLSLASSPKISSNKK